MNNPTVKQLKEQAIEKGIPGYSTMKKAELLQALDIPKPLTVSELRTYAGILSIPDHGNLRRAELIKVIEQVEETLDKTQIKHAKEVFAALPETRVKHQDLDESIDSYRKAALDGCIIDNEKTWKAMKVFSKSELQAKAKQLGIPGYSKYNKDDLIRLMVFGEPESESDESEPEESEESNPEEPFDMEYYKDMAKDLGIPDYDQMEKTALLSALGERFGCAEED